MKLSYNLYGGQTLIKNYPVYGNGANINEGAAVMIGATSGTNQGFAILAASALAKVIGVNTSKLVNASAGTDSKQDGTVITYKQIIINPDAVYAIDHSSPAVEAIAVASSSTTTVTITSLETGIAGGWLYGSDFQLQYIVTSTSGSCTTKSATSWVSTTTVAKIHPIFFSLAAINTTGDLIKNAAAAGTGKVVFFENYIRGNGIPYQKLDPTKHSGTTFDASVVISHEMSFRDHAFQIVNY